MILCIENKGLETSFYCLIIQEIFNYPEYARVSKAGKEIF